MGEVTYTGLDTTANTIRLLDLLPGRWTEQISCEIRTASLDAKPAYEALSYVWGNPQDTLPIIVSGSVFKATQNLVAGLRRLRSSRHSRILWVDAICINQKDIEEKTQQLGLMHKIYESASSVQVFLGESGILDLIPLEEQATWEEPPRFYWHRDGTYLLQSRKPPSRTAMDPQGFVKDLHEALLGEDAPGYDPVDTREFPMWAVWKPERGIIDQPRVDAFLARQKDDKYDPSKLTAVQALRDSQAGAFAIMNVLSNGGCLKSCLQSDSSSPPWTKALEVLDHLIKLSWWTRIWVLQEAILPHGAVIAIYGEIAAPIGLIEDSGSILPRHYEKGECCKIFWNNLPSNQQNIINTFAQLMGRLEGIRDMWKQIHDSQLHMLILYLQRTRYKEATDLRDKIFALLGLVSNCPNPVDLLPDYKQSIAHVYTDMAMRIIHHQRSLHIILNHEKKDLVSGLPTWVPNWSQPYGSMSDYLISARLTQFMAWPPGPGRLPELIDHYALGVTGNFVDRVTHVTKSLIRAETDLTKTIDELEVFFGLTDNFFKVYKGKIMLADAFWRTMFGDLLYSIDRSMINELVVFDRAQEGDAWPFDMARYAWGNKTRNITYLKPDGTLWSEEEIAHIARRARENFWYANEGKVFFKTASGYIGSGPPDTRLNDHVYVVFGSSVPLILRPTADVPPLPSVSNKAGASLSGPWYNLVGYAYVHGIMDGEAAPTQTHASASEGRRKLGPMYTIGLDFVRTKLRPKAKKGPQQIYLV